MPNDYDDPTQYTEPTPPPPPGPYPYPTSNPYAGGMLSGLYGNVHPGAPIEEQNRYHAQQWLMILRQAHEIRQNPEAMVLIRELIRLERDTLAAILDDA